jgi:hypothetical protein
MLVFDIGICKVSVRWRYVEIVAGQTPTLSRRNYGELLGHQCDVKDAYVCHQETVMCQVEQ